MALQLRSRRKSLPSPSLIRFFSEKPDPDADSLRSSFTPDDTDSKPQSSTPHVPLSDYLSEVKARLKLGQQQREQQQQQRYNRPTFSSSFRASDAPDQQPSRATSPEDIFKNLSEFRRRSAVPDPLVSNVRPVSFQELYNRNVVARTGEANSGGPGSGPTNRGGNLSFKAIRESLHKMNSGQSAGFDALPKSKEPMSLLRLTDSLSKRPGLGDSSSGFEAIGGDENLPSSVFGKEMRERKDREGTRSDGRSKTEFLRMYSYTDLGGKLKMLRPESVAKGTDGKGWFSLEELNERLVKLREMEEKHTGGPSFRGLRESLVHLKHSDDEKTRKRSRECLQTYDFSFGSCFEMLGRVFELDDMEDWFWGDILSPSFLLVST